MRSLLCLLLTATATATAAEPPLRILAVGDSLTAGFNQAEGNAGKYSFHPYTR
jgi:hypothetical protein